MARYELKYSEMAYRQRGRSSLQQKDDRQCQRSAIAERWSRRPHSI